MNEQAITVEGLGKSYRLRHRATGSSLREQLTSALRAPFRSKAPRGTTEEFWALRDVSFSVRQGDVVGIVGRNGAGKSTLLKLLSRITEPTTGRITLQGRVASLLEVGTGFHGELSGRENIYLNGAILGMSRAEIRRKFDEIVAFAEVERFLDTAVKHYSSGMYVRLAFAVAAHLEPEILIVDEVLAVGDAAFQKKCLGKMQDVAAGHGRTVLFVSHNAAALLNVCRSGLWLEQGRVVKSGAIGDVLGAYLKTNSKIESRYEAAADKPRILAVSLDQDALARGRLEVSVEFASPFPLSPPIVGLVLSNKLGQPLTGFNGRMAGEKWRPGPVSSGVVTGTIQSLPLLSDTYRISVWLGDSGMDYDHKPDALEFDFVSPNFYPQSPSIEVHGPLDLPWEWSLQNPR
jgi:lipopolysaccharide transport system ATP-binding protein